MSVLKKSFRALYDIVSIYGNGLGWFGGGLGWFGVFWGVSMDCTTVMLTVY